MSQSGSSPSSSLIRSRRNGASTHTSSVPVAAAFTTAGIATPHVSGSRGPTTPNTSAVPAST